jgi:uncharacterized membrane protein
MHALLALLVMALAHTLTVWAIPRLIMDRIITLGGGDAAMQQSGTGVYLPPPTDHTQRRIVMPSPDLLYATCAFDVSERPLRISLDTRYERYWSIALYASNSDTFFVDNDRDAPDGRVDLQVQGPQHVGPSAAGQIVTAPTHRGFLLMRLLVNDDPVVRASAEAARRTLSCSAG